MRADLTPTPNEQGHEDRYVLELSALRDGDVILEAGHAPHSAAIKAAIGSNYSHVMIYLDRTIFEATKNGAVFTRVPNRFTVKSSSDLKVLRYGQELSRDSLDRMIVYAREHITTSYSVPEAVRSAGNKKPIKKKSGQFCSRLVAEILYAGNVVATSNIHYCSPADIEKTQESGMFSEVKKAVRKATPEEVAHANSGELHPKHQKATVEWTKKAKKLIGRNDVQTMNDIFQALIDSRSLKLDKLISCAMIDSGYLDTYDDEKANNSYRYDVAEFSARLETGLINLSEEILKEIPIVRLQLRNIEATRANLQNTGGMFRVFKINHDICERGLREAGVRLGVLLAACSMKRIISEEVEMADQMSREISDALSRR